MTKKLEQGTEIYYTGDRANASGTGEITKAYSDRWGQWYDISLEDGREFRAVSILAVTDNYQGHANPRFATLESYEAVQAQRVADYNALIESLRAKKAS